MQCSGKVSVCNYWQHRATLKKKLVSCVAGGPNHGHSGGRKFFFSRFFEGVRKLLKKINWGGGGNRKFKQKGPSRHKYSQPAAGQETNFFLRVA